jgi:recombinational DNA repair protein (RecF pathway)
MLEYITEAVILDKIDLKEQDSKAFLFTKDFGRISAKITSGRKITSKLAAHTEPLNFVTVRVVDKNSPQLIDALAAKKAMPSKIIFKIFSLIKEISPEGQPEPDLWNLLVELINREAREGDFNEALKILGFDPIRAKCNNCLNGSPDFFSIRDLAFYCRDCYIN